MKLLVLSALVAVALSKPLESLDEDHQWELFKLKHEKEYSSELEEQQRKKILLSNVNFVREHNAKFEKGEVTFDVEINKFSDMSNKEFVEKMNGFRVPAGYKRTVEEFSVDDYSDLPSSVDWRKEGAVTPVKDQGTQCVSSWAFSATGSLEGQTFIKTKKLISLSEQNLIDCSNKERDRGCHGGFMHFAFQYVKDNNGIDTETSYPYKGKKSSNKGATDNGFTDISPVSDQALQQAVAKVGPISVAIDASQPSFQHYKSGVYIEPNCSSTILDLAVLAVGYGTIKQGGPYWIVKNSWGTNWGMQGYILMARNHDDMCGIASMATYPNV